MEEPINHEQEICRFMADDYVSKIMHATFGRALNVRQISEMCDIPVALAHRRVREMAEIGLLTCAKEKQGLGGEYERFYQCAVSRIQYIFDRGTFSCLICLEDDPTNLQMTEEH